MKTTLEFNLPEDREELKLAMNAASYYVALVDLQDLIRARLKYGNPSEAELKIYEELRDDFHRILSNHDLSL